MFDLEIKIFKYSNLRPSWFWFRYTNINHREISLTKEQIKEFE